MSLLALDIQIDPWVQLSKTLRQMKRPNKIRRSAPLIHPQLQSISAAMAAPSAPTIGSLTAVNFPRRVCLIHEQATRDAFERVTGKLFPKVRPRFLRNPASGRNLELDGYCQELKLAFEYDGALHSTFPNSFHRTHAQFVAQQQRDVLKDQLCRNAGIRLLRVSCDVTLSDIDAHVMSLLPRSNMGTS